MIFGHINYYFNLLIKHIESVIFKQEDRAQCLLYLFVDSLYIYHGSDVCYQPQAVVEHVYTCVARFDYYSINE